jgi:hypothetical protein
MQVTKSVNVTKFFVNLRHFIIPRKRQNIIHKSCMLVRVYLIIFALTMNYKL